MNRPARLYNLDYLRGFAAFGIMLYHYLWHIQGDFSASSFMGRVSVYGVSIFYILSGLTLFHVYYGKMRPSGKDIKDFFVKRIFRIFPLLWLVTLLAIFLSHTKPDLVNLFLNLSGLFGFVKWDTYFSAGIWSIGNELVFYVFFPVFILFVKRSRPLMILTSLALFGVYLYFSFNVLTANQSLAAQWKNYTNPLNQVFLFLAGFLAGFFFRNARISNPMAALLLLVGFLLFVLFPATGDVSSIVTGSNRLVFTAACLLICIGFYKITIQFPRFIHRPLAFLGESSYSVYLLHSIIWIIVEYLSRVVEEIVHIQPYGLVIIAIIITLVASNFVYRYFELYFINLSRKEVRFFPLRIVSKNPTDQAQ